MQACGNTSLSLRFSSDIWVNTECKAIFAVASFHNSSSQFCKTCVVFYYSKFVRSRDHIQVYLTVRLLYQGFIDRFGRDPRRLQLLFWNQGFSNGALVPPWGPRSCSLRVTCRGRAGATSRGRGQNQVLLLMSRGPQVLRVFWRVPWLMKVWEPLF